MKRSEMLTLLRGDIWGSGYLSYSEATRLAEILLESIEKAGMQPPNITIDELIPGSGLKTDPSQSQHYYACWEPEQAEEPFNGKRSGAV